MVRQNNKAKNGKAKNSKVKNGTANFYIKNNKM
jgi:hypothetical protein